MSAKTQDPSGFTATESTENTSADGCGTCRQLSRRRFMAATGAAAIALAAGPGLASAEVQEGRDGIDWDNDYVQNPYIGEDALTKAKHDMAWGTDDDGLRTWENDSGDAEELPIEIDREDTENVVTLRADRMQGSSQYAFPRGITYDHDSDDSTDEKDVTALDATHWSTTDAATGTIAVQDGDTDVEYSLNVASDSLADGETVTATFDLSSVGSDDATIDTDVAKRYFSGVVNVGQLDANAEVDLVAVSSDDDEKVLSIDPDGDTANDNVVADATGDGIAFQVRMDDLAIDGSGDGTMQDIQTVKIRISASGGAADADVTLTALSLEEKSRWEFGSYLANEDTDDEERTKRYEPSGEFTVTDLGTLGESFSDAMLYGVTFPCRWTLELSDGDHEYEFVEIDDPTYQYEFVQRGKLEVEAGIDLSHAGLTYQDDVSVSSRRYDSVRIAEGVDKAFADMEDADWTGKTSLYETSGTTVDLDTSVQTATVYDYESRLLVTADDKEAIETAAGGGPPPESNGGGGWLSGFRGLAAAVITGIVGALALIRRKAGA